ncbi:MAG TPA: copper amine oxidase N-terminal domain-containing protein [Symbiobacteriaceae bacterium]|nr:copper amine oxidase N-terminal domain-containing protein [Symbiobacteriaceae bacterium]
MATITVRGPDSVRAFIRPIPGDTHDVCRLSYMGSGEYLVHYATPAHVDPAEVARILRELQAAGVPLGAVGDYEILCLDMRILPDTDPAAPHVDGVQRPLYIALSGRPGVDLRDLLAHELTHRLAAVLLTPAEEQQLFDLVGYPMGSNTDPWWHLRPQEWLAEWLSLALWGCPVENKLIPQLTDDQVAQVRDWALQQLGSGPPATIRAEGECISLQVGNPVMDRYGTPVALDVAPMHIDPPGRVFVPIRAISEALGRRVEWTEETKTVRIY